MKVLGTVLFTALVLVVIPSWLITSPVLSSKIKVDIPVDKDRLYGHVNTLTSISPARNHINIFSLDQAADYIYKELEASDCRMKRQEYEIKGVTYQNIIGSVGPSEGPRLIVGAHYDVCGEQAGADDNASAVAGLLEIAKLIQLQQPDLKHRIDFVAYTLEEPPYFGSDYMGSAIHAKYLSENNIDVKGMICLEMIGYFSEENGSQDYPIGLMRVFYPDKGNFIAVIGKLDQGKIVRRVKKFMKQVADIDVRSINAPPSLKGIDFSDHRNYWKYDYPAVMINNTAFYRNKNYHEISDTIGSLDFDKMTEVVRGAYWAVLNF